jgi:hypothetical protein
MDDQRFKRWQWIEFGFRRPTQDRRAESCHVFEDTIICQGQLAVSDRYALIDPMLLQSASAAREKGETLAVIRPRNTRFVSKPKPRHILAAEAEAYRAASRQRDFLDKDLACFNPSPYEFAFHFEDADGRHTWRCGDWETHATFIKWRREHGDAEAARLLAGRYNDEYPKRGMVFAIGNIAKRQQIWQLLGVIRLDEKGQLGLL